MINLIPSWATHYEAFWETIRRRNLWFIKLRYGAVLMLTAFIVLTELFFEFDYSRIQLSALIIITSSILIYNLILNWVRKFLKCGPEGFNPLHFSLSANAAGFDCSFIFNLLYRRNRNSIIYAFHFSHGNRKLNSTGLYYLFNCRLCNYSFFRDSNRQLISANSIIPHPGFAGLLSNKQFKIFGFCLINFFICNVNKCIACK